MFGAFVVEVGVSLRPVDLREVPELTARIAQTVFPSVKRDTSWSGYKVHLTETCHPDEVHLITHVATTVATTPDTGMIADVHRDLARRDLLPSVHLADAGYVNAPQLVSPAVTTTSR